MDEVVALHHLLLQFLELLGDFLDGLSQLEEKDGSGLLEGVELFTEVAAFLLVLFFQGVDVVLEGLGEVALVVVIAAHGADEGGLGALAVEAHVIEALAGMVFVAGALFISHAVLRLLGRDHGLK